MEARICLFVCMYIYMHVYVYIESMQPLYFGFVTTTLRLQGGHINVCLFVCLYMYVCICV